MTFPEETTIFSKEDVAYQLGFNAGRMSLTKKKKKNTRCQLCKSVIKNLCCLSIFFIFFVIIVSWYMH